MPNPELMQSETTLTEEEQFYLELEREQESAVLLLDLVDELARQLDNAEGYAYTKALDNLTNLIEKHKQDIAV